MYTCQTQLDKIMETTVKLGRHRYSFKTVLMTSDDGDGDGDDDDDNDGLLLRRFPVSHRPAKLLCQKKIRAISIKPWPANYNNYYYRNVSVID